MIGSTDGIEEMRQHVWDAWREAATAIVGYVPEMRFAGTEKADPPDKTKYWARLATSSFSDVQATLSTCVQKPYSRRYRDEGMLVVQIFAPLTASNADYNRGKLAEVVQRCLRAGRTPSGIWFNKARIVPMDPENLFSRANVMCEYQREEIQ